MNDALEQIVATELDRLGFDLVEWRLGGTKARPSLQLRIDRRDGATVKVDDCAAASRAIESRLDLERPMGERYLLEVSSPGVERALKRAADWRRFVGRRATMTSAAKMPSWSKLWSSARSSCLVLVISRIALRMSLELTIECSRVVRYQ